MDARALSLRVMADARSGAGAAERDRTSIQINSDGGWMNVFKKDKVGYERWLTAHPDGFGLNGQTLHRSSCDHIGLSSTNCLTT